MHFFTYFLLIFIIIVNCFAQKGETKKLLMELNASDPNIRIKLNGNCKSLTMCFKSALFGGGNFPWKVSRRFRLNSFLSKNSGKCDKNAKSIRIAMNGTQFSIDNEYFNITPNSEIAIHFNSNKCLAQLNGTKKPFPNFGQQFSDQLKDGSFLDDFAGLWLLGLAIMPQFGQKTTKIFVEMSNECQLKLPSAMTVRSNVPSCVTFNSSQAERHGPLRPMILGGAEIDIKIAPWTVRFKGFVRKSKNNTSVHINCGGSLISSEFVLLAAHCFDFTENGKKYIIAYNTTINVDRIKGPKNTVSGVRQDGKNVFIHPKYNDTANPVNLYHDLALIKLDPPLEGVVPICIQCGGPLGQFQNGTAYVTGWGQETDDCESKTRASERLKGRHVQIVECKSKRDREEHICVEPNTVMEGDSGGALLANNGTHFVQIALLSGGSCVNKKSSINYFIPLDKEWIKKITGFNCPN